MGKRIRIVILIFVFILLATGMTYGAGTFNREGKLALFRNISIPEDSTLDGPIVNIFSNVDIDGSVNGDIVTIFGKVDADGNINGNLVTIFGKVDTDEVINGNVVTIFGNLDMGPHATITYNKVQILGSSTYRPTSKVLGDEIDIISISNVFTGVAGFFILIMLLIIVKSLIAYIFSLLLVNIAPERIDKITNSLPEDILKRFAIGLLIVVGFYISIPILAPIIPFLALAKFILGFAGNTVVKMAIGRKIGKGRQWTNILELTVGSLIYTLLELTIILKPVLWFAKLVGMGTIIDTRLGTVDFWGYNNENKSVSDVKNDIINNSNNINSNNNSEDNKPD